MEKIIYNNKLKKLLISILVVMMLMTYVKPYVAWASDSEGYELKTYTEWVTYIGDKDWVETKTRLYFENLPSFKQAYNDDQRSEKINEILSEPDKLTLKAKYTKPGFLKAAEFDITAYGIVDDDGEAKQQYKMKYQELLEWSGKTSEEIDPMIITAIQDDYYAGVENLVEGTPEQVCAEILELNKDIIILTVYGTKDEFEIRDFEIPGKSESEAEIESGESLGIATSEDNVAIETIDTLTGKMLEPVMALAKFLADTLMSILTTFMTQSEFEFVMVDNKEDITDLGEPGTTFTIPHMGLYKNAFGKLSIDYPNFKYSPEEIFAGKIDLLNVNFIEKSNDDTNWNKIRNIVSSFYKVLRMVAIIGLLSVLIYTGIKIIISSNTKDKAKYKELILNWFIGVVLAFSMHYIMAFILNVVEEVMGVLEGLTGVIEVTAGDETFKTNLIGLARFQLQQRTFSAKVGYLVMYVALITYTFKFTFIYLKRVLIMAFLTVISPIVALTYPIDKANDGKAKGFEMWLKEFMYNALLQPLHYILYYILVSTSLSLAANNLIYGIAALMFISHAEKLLKKIFNFGKAGAGTVGGLAGAFATGAVTSTLNNMAKDPMHPLNSLTGGGSGSSGGGQTQSKDSNSNSDNDNDELASIRDDTNFENYFNTDMRLDYATQNYGAQNDDNEQVDRTSRGGTESYGSGGSTSRMPLVDDFISRYRQGIPETALEELSFNDGYGSMKSLMNRIEDYESKLANPNLSDAERQKYEQKLFECKAALQKRLTDNEAGFNNTGIPLQYNDGDRRTNSELIDEMMRLKKILDSDKSLTPEERGKYGAEYKRLYKRLKRRMAENQYIQRQGGAQALIDQERLRMLAETSEQGNGANPIVNGYTGPIDGTNPIIGQQPNRNGNQPANPVASQTQNNPVNPGTNQTQNNSVNPGVNQNSNNNNYQSRRATTQLENNRARRAEERKVAIENFKNARVTKGLANVGKTIIKPAWDVEKSTSYNTTRLVGNLAKALAGVTVGVTAAAVQAGISITDGNYKAMEGAATFGAGFIGVSKIAQKAGGLIDTYREAAYSGEDKESLEKYGEQWFNRDDIISNYNREFPGQGKAMRQRAVNNYVSRGITSFEEQKQAIKFAEQLKKERGMSEEQADWIAAGTLRYRQNLINNDNYEILFDSKRKEKYLDAQANSSSNSSSRDDIRRKHDEFLQNVMDFDRANR